jgi:CRISPR-associated protein Cas5d
MSGELACFTRPELKVERMSYEVMTPAAARNVLNNIFYKPQIRWRVHSIAVLRPIRLLSFRRNEINALQSSRVRAFYCDDEQRRAQRNTVALRDVEYLVTASFVLTDQIGEDNIGKYVGTILRRLEGGQHFQQPFLGCREFAADVRLLKHSETVSPIDVNRELGMMFYDFDYTALDRRRWRATAEGPDDLVVKPHFFRARLTDGVLRIPDWDEVKRGMHQ